MKDRPSYAKDFPEDEELLALVDAFEAGNYRAVREGVAKILANESKLEPVKSAARDLKSRTEPNRAQIALLVITAVLVVVLSGYEIVKHGPNAPPPPKPAIERVH